MDDIGAMDWLNMPKAERVAAIKSLYQAVGAVAAATDQTIDQLVLAALPTEPGSSYGSNFRRGNIAAAKALLIHRQFEEHYFELAQSFAPALFQTNPQSAWAQFLKAHTIVGGARVVPYPQLGIAERDAGHSDAIVLRLGQGFVFEIIPPGRGCVTAFEGYGKDLHPLPLAEDERVLKIEVTEETQLLPRSKTGEPLPLFEHNDAGLHRFADPPPLKWSSAMFRKTEETHGKQATEARGNCYEVTAG